MTSLTDRAVLATANVVTRPRTPRMARLYSSPFAHCPTLCPYDPPPTLFADEYDPWREGTAWVHCLAHCPLVAGRTPPCIARYRAG